MLEIYKKARYQRMRAFFCKKFKKTYSPQKKISTEPNLPFLFISVAHLIPVLVCSFAALFCKQFPAKRDCFFAKVLLKRITHGSKDTRIF